MHLPPHSHPQRRHLRLHIHRHHWFPSQPYYALSPPHSALIHHWIVMLLSPHPHAPHHHPRLHICRHHWFPGQISPVQLRPVIAG